MAVEAGSFMGNDLVFFPNIDANSGKIGVGISRKAGQGGVDGSGAVARVQMRLSENATIGDTLNFVLQNVAANDSSGNAIEFQVQDFLVVTSVEEGQPVTIPEEFALRQNYPNPLNPETRIAYDLPKSVHIRIEIFNLLGQKMRTLVDDQKPAGSHTMVWDGRKDNGAAVASGVYIYRLQTKKFVQSRKLLLLR